MSRVQKYKRADIAATMTLRSIEKPFYYKVRLWKSHATMCETLGIDTDAMAVCGAEWDENAQGEIALTDFLGEIHFAMGCWSLNIVAHEIQHAVIHKARVAGPHLDTMSSPMQDLEELLAYEAGFWVEKVYRWLEKKDPDHDERKWVVCVPDELLLTP